MEIIITLLVLGWLAVTITRAVFDSSDEVNSILDQQAEKIELFDAANRAGGEKFGHSLSQTRVLGR